jgi:hypothetical protein
MCHSAEEPAGREMDISIMNVSVATGSRSQGKGKLFEEV